MPYAYSIFIDFDGTITENDVGYEMFKRFTNSRTEPLVEKYRIGEINSHQCLSGECEIWNACAPSPADIDGFLKAQPVRRGFGNFCEYLQSLEIYPIILSEGFDFYIDKFLSHHGLPHLTRITNAAIYENGRLMPSFPFYGNGCPDCSNCKGYHISRLRPFKSCAILIGDGHSDLHASRAADIVFARSYLGEIMSKSGAAFVPYNDFMDIRTRIEEIFSEGIFAAGESLAFKFFSSRHHDSFRDLWECGEVMQFVGYPNGLGWSRQRYNRHFVEMESWTNAISLAVEDISGVFLGEAKISFPDRDGFCYHDLKLLPQFWGKSIGFEAWKMILDKAGARGPDAKAAVTPSIENERAISLYQKLGFQFAGDIETWEPAREIANAVPVRFRKMVRDQN